MDTKDLEKRVESLEKEVKILKDVTFGSIEVPIGEYIAETRKMVEEGAEVSSAILEEKFGVSHGSAVGILDFLEGQGVLGPADEAGVRKALKKNIPS